MGRHSVLVGTKGWTPPLSPIKGVGKMHIWIIWSYTYLSALSEVNTCDLKIQIWKMPLFSLDFFKTLESSNSINLKRCNIFTWTFTSSTQSRDESSRTADKSLQFLPQPSNKPGHITLGSAKTRWARPCSYEFQSFSFVPLKSWIWFIIIRFNKASQSKMKSNTKSMRN